MWGLKMPNMIRQAKKYHAEKIASKLIRSFDAKTAPSMHRDYVKDLQKLNYTTLVALSPRVK